MKIEVTEIRWVDQDRACSLHELVEASRLSEDELGELVELGVLRPLQPAGAESAAAAAQAGGTEAAKRWIARCAACATTSASTRMACRSRWR